jgi:hypothetical protein
LLKPNENEGLYDPQVAGSHNADRSARVVYDINHQVRKHLLLTKNNPTDTNNNVKHNIHRILHQVSRA